MSSSGIDLQTNYSSRSSCLCLFVFYSSSFHGSLILMHEIRVLNLRIEFLAFWVFDVFFKRVNFFENPSRRPPTSNSSLARLGRAEGYLGPNFRRTGSYLAKLNNSCKCLAQNQSCIKHVGSKRAPSFSQLGRVG